MKLDTAYFRLLAQHSHHALLAVAVSLGDKRNAAAMRELLPVFMNDMPQSPLFTKASNVPVAANNDVVAKQESFPDAFRRVLGPITEKGVRWTSDQAAFFEDATPYLKSESFSSRQFLLAAVKTVKDPALLALHEHACQSGEISMVGEFEHILLQNAATALNEPIFSALLEKVETSKVRSWFDCLNDEVETQKALVFMSMIEACWNDKSMRPVIDHVMHGLESSLAFQVRLRLLTNLVEPPAGANGHDDWRDEDTVAVMATKNIDEAWQKIQAHAQIVSDTMNSVQAADGLTSTSYPASVFRLANVALKSHWLPMLQATSSILEAAGTDYDPYPRVMEKRPHDLTAFKETVAFLAQMGHPLTNPPIVLGQRPQVSALAHLARSSNLDKWQGKLSALLDLGADPSVPDTQGKKPVDLVKPKARRDEWKGVIVSHAARCAAMDAISNIMADECKGPAP